jgi:CRISPR-associated protein Cmr3
MTTNKSTYTYFVEIKPTGYFFFGNEQSFNTKEIDKYEKEVNNYFAKSNLYPQQTAILGLIRHSLLAFYNSLDNGVDQKSKIIGIKNFDGIHDNTFGYINSISPLVICKEVNKKIQILTPAPFTQQEKNTITAKFNNTASYINKSSDNTIELEKFDYKDFATDVNWQDEDGEIVKDIYEKALTKVGIDKKKKEEAFFKQELHKLKKDFSFGVWVTFNEEIKETPNFLIPFGGDQSIFKILFHSEIENIFNVIQTDTKHILLLSDAYIDEAIFEDIDFAINTYTNFRYIHSKDKNFYMLSGNDKSDKSILMQRGSVLYCKDASKVAAKLRSNKAFRNIGYNYFKFI